MKLKLMFAFFGVALPLGSALALTTPEQIKELPVGTTFSGIPAGEFSKVGAIPQDSSSLVQLVRTSEGFSYVHAGSSGADAPKAVCNDIGKAGGKGNATVNCALAGGEQLRFEWLDTDHVQYEYWFSMAHKAGQTRNNPGQATATLTRREPVRTGSIIGPGNYRVSFGGGVEWADVHYTLNSDGSFIETKDGQVVQVVREGTWQEVDGDFCHIDRDIICYKLLHKNDDGTIALQYKPTNTAGVQYTATWLPESAP